MKKIRIGILGCANIAGRLVIPAIASSDNFKLTAVASRSHKKAQAFASKFNCNAVKNYQSLIDRDDIDAIYIPLPIGLHHEWVIKCLESGKHVLCEKSLAPDYGTVKSMVETARSHSLVLIENFAFVFHSQHKFVLDKLKNGEIGQIRCFRGSFGFPPFTDDNIRYSKKLGGGSLLDAGSYAVKATQLIFGHDIKVTSAFLGYETGKEVDIYGGASLVSGSGHISQIAFGFDNYYQCNYEIWGSRGKLISERAFTAAPDIRPKVIIEKQNEKHEYTLPQDNHFLNILEHFHDSIRNNSLESNYSELLNQSQLLTQIQEHAKR